MRACEPCLQLAKVRHRAEGGDLAEHYRRAHAEHVEKERLLRLLSSVRTIRYRYYKGRRVEDVDLPP